jgi:rubrerythrin
MSESYNAEKINAVWNRVMATQNTAKTGQNEMQWLCAMMDSVATDAIAYRTMARACRDGANRRLFLNIATEKTRHLHALQAAYFAKVGDSYVPHTKQQPIHGLLAALQARYTSEQKQVKTYTQAMQNTHDQQLQKLYKTLTADAQHHLEAIGNVIKRLMH